MTNQVAQAVSKKEAARREKEQKLAEEARKKFKAAVDSVVEALSKQHPRTSDCVRVGAQEVVRQVIRRKNNGSHELPFALTALENSPTASLVALYNQVLPIARDYLN